MHIVQRSQADMDLFRLKGKLDEPGFKQLDFILRAMPSTKAVLFDFRRVVNAGDPGVSHLFRRLADLAPADRQVGFTGISGKTVRNLSREGVPQAVFI